MVDLTRAVLCRAKPRDMLTLHLNTGYNLLTTCTCACMFYVRLSLKVHRKQQKYRLLKGNDLRHVC